MGKNQLRLLKFLIQFPVSWHSIGQDSRRTARNLEALGLVEINDYWQARLSITATNREILQGLIKARVTIENASNCLKLTLTDIKK